MFNRNQISAKGLGKIDQFVEQLPLSQLIKVHFDPNHIKQLVSQFVIQKAQQELLDVQVEGLLSSQAKQTYYDPVLQSILRFMKQRVVDLHGYQPEWLIPNQQVQYSHLKPTNNTVLKTPKGSVDLGHICHMLRPREFLPVRQPTTYLQPSVVSYNKLNQTLTIQSESDCTNIYVVVNFANVSSAQFITVYESETDTWQVQGPVAQQQIASCQGPLLGNNAIGAYKIVAAQCQLSLAISAVTLGGQIQMCVLNQLTNINEMCWKYLEYDPTYKKTGIFNATQTNLSYIPNQVQKMVTNPTQYPVFIYSMYAVPPTMVRVSGAFTVEYIPTVNYGNLQKDYPSSCVGDTWQFIAQLCRLSQGRLPSWSIQQKNQLCRYLNSKELGSDPLSNIRVGSVGSVVKKIATTTAQLATDVVVPAVDIVTKAFTGGRRKQGLNVSKMDRSMIKGFLTDQPDQNTCFYDLLQAQKFVLQKMGITASYNKASKTITVRKGGKLFTLKTPVVLSSVLQIYPGTIYLKKGQQYSLIQQGYANISAIVQNNHIESFDGVLSDVKKCPKVDGDLRIGSKWVLPMREKLLNSMKTTNGGSVQQTMQKVYWSGQNFVNKAVQPKANRSYKQAVDWFNTLMQGLNIQQFSGPKLSLGRYKTASSQKQLTANLQCVCEFLTYCKNNGRTPLITRGSYYATLSSCSIRAASLSFVAGGGLTNFYVQISKSNSALIKQQIQGLVPYYYLQPQIQIRTFTTIIAKKIAQQKQKGMWVTEYIAQLVDYLTAKKITQKQIDYATKYFNQLDIPQQHLCAQTAADNSKEFDASFKKQSQQPIKMEKIEIVKTPQLVKTQVKQQQPKESIQQKTIPAKIQQQEKPKVQLSVDSNVMYCTPKGEQQHDISFAMSNPADVTINGEQSKLDISFAVQPKKQQQQKWEEVPQMVISQAIPWGSAGKQHSSFKTDNIKMVTWMEDNFQKMTKMLVFSSDANYVDKKLLAQLQTKKEKPSHKNLSQYRFPNAYFLQSKQQYQACKKYYNTIQTYCVNQYNKSFKEILATGNLTDKQWARKLPRIEAQLGLVKGQGVKQYTEAAAHYAIKKLQIANARAKQFGTTPRSRIKVKTPIKEMTQTSVRKNEVRQKKQKSKMKERVKSKQKTNKSKLKQEQQKNVSQNAKEQLPQSFYGTSYSKMSTLHCFGVLYQITKELTSRVGGVYCQCINQHMIMAMGNEQIVFKEDIAYQSMFSQLIIPKQALINLGNNNLKQRAKVLQMAGGYKSSDPPIKRMDATQVKQITQQVKANSQIQDAKVKKAQKLRFQIQQMAKNMQNQVKKYDTTKNDVVKRFRANYRIDLCWQTFCGLAVRLGKNIKYNDHDIYYYKTAVESTPQAKDFMLAFDSFNNKLIPVNRRWTALQGASNILDQLGDSVAKGRRMMVWFLDEPQKALIQAMAVVSGVITHDQFKQLYQQYLDDDEQYVFKTPENAILSRDYYNSFRNKCFAYNRKVPGNIMQEVTPRGKRDHSKKPGNRAQLRKQRFGLKPQIPNTSASRNVSPRLTFSPSFANLPPLGNMPPIGTGLNTFQQMAQFTRDDRPNKRDE